MAGVSIKLAGASFSDPIASARLPSLQGLVAEFILGGSKAESVINMAKRSTPGTAKGAPVYGAGFVTTVATADSIDLNVPHPTQDFTAILVSRAGVGTFGALGTHQFLGAQYSGFDKVDADGNYFWNSNPSRDGVAKLANPPASQQFVFQAGVAPLGGLSKLFMGTNGVLAVAAATKPGISPRPVLPNFTISGQAITRGGDTAYLALYDRALSDAEIASAYTSLKTFLSGRGLSVS